MKEKKNKTESRPRIVISLHPVLEAYCRWIFKTEVSDKEISIDRRHDIGKHIYSHVMQNKYPVKGPEKSNPVVFILPLHDNHIKNKFLFVDQWGESKINDFIRSDFNAWCRRRFEVGFLYGWTQKEITDAIMRGLNLRENVVNFDAIKKNDYRNRRKIEEIRFENLFVVD